MKTNLVLATIALSSIAPSNAGLLPLRQHIDVHWTYTSGDGWSCEAKTDALGIDTFRDFDDVYLPLDDAPTASGGQRRPRSQNSAFDFTGVAAGEPIWIAPQIQVQDQCWPGFNNYQPTGTFGRYKETDSRLPQADRDLELPWIKVAFTGMTYQGAGNPSFSMWQVNSSSSPTVWFSTADTTTPDIFLFVAGSHIHVNWGFGAQGIYRIRLSASAFEGLGQTNPTGASDPYTITFAVGPFAQWQATYFSGLELENPLISGPDADPDQDGMKNTVEFAFGYHPKNGAAVPVSTGLGLPKLSLVAESGTFYEVLEYPQRRAGEQLAPLVYTPGFSSILNSESWSQTGVDTTVADFPAPLDSLNPVWESVTSKRAVGPAVPPRGFGRVTVGAGSE